MVLIRCKSCYGIKDGKVTAMAPGTAKITASVDGKTAVCTVNVTATLKGISLNKSELNLKKGQSEKLVVSYDPADTTDKKMLYGQAVIHLSYQ